MDSSKLLGDPNAAWTEWKPTPQDPWNHAKAAHLHRRAGLGGTWRQVERDVAAGVQTAVQTMLEGESHGPDGRTATEITDITHAMVDSIARDPNIERVQFLWLFRLIYSPHPLAERMTLAWHTHYATSNEKVRNPPLMLAQNLTQRELWKAPISQLHLNMLKDGAMLTWLDGLDSRVEQPNENLAREFFELFALGEGNYNEADVQATARALTGFVRASGLDGHARFDPDAHDGSTKTILGQTGPWGVEDVVRIACQQPASAQHIARRLFNTFIADTLEPPSGLIESLASVIRRPADVDVAKGIEIILNSRVFFSDWCRGKRVKSPVELVIGAIRSCERFHPPQDFIELDGWLTRMGQRLFYPPNVAGWPAGLNWLRGPTLLARASFASRFASEAGSADTIRKRFSLEQPDARRQALETLILGVPSPGKSTTGSPDSILRQVLSSAEAQLA